MQTPKTVKDIVVKLLEREFPLGVKDIQNRILFEYEKEVTAQAIHKALNELLDEGVVVKEKHEYKLSTKYIMELDALVRELKENYFSKNVSPFSVGEGESCEFEAESLSELDRLWNKIIFEYLGNVEKDSVKYVQQVPHAWFNLVQMGDELKVTERIMEKTEGFYTLANGNTKLDNWLAKFYRDKNSFYVTKGNPDEGEINHQVAVLGEYVIESFYPKNLARRIDVFFKDSENFINLDIAELLSVAHAQNKVKLTIFHDDKKARKTEQNILKEFE